MIITKMMTTAVLAKPRSLCYSKTPPKNSHGMRFPSQAITYNPTQAPHNRTTKRTRTKQSTYDNIENIRPNDDNNNDDVDCFP